MAVMERFQHGRLISTIHKKNKKINAMYTGLKVYSTLPLEQAHLFPGGSLPFRRLVCCSLLYLEAAWTDSRVDTASLLEGRQDTRNSMQRPGD